jgi:hypothetical protein
LLSSVSLLDQNKFVWNDNLSPFDEKSGNIAAIWLDFVDPSHTTYWWKDENKPPVAMFRIGEMDTAVVRVMARNSAGKIVFIEELKHLFLLESDFMLPGWIGVASGWARRLSLQLGFDSKRVEYTFAEPPDQEEINQIPANVTRFYFGETVSNR